MSIYTLFVRVPRVWYHQYKMIPMLPIHDYFKLAGDKGASDLHLVAGEIPMLRIHGNLFDVDQEKLSPHELETQIFSIISAEQKERFLQNHDLDLALSMAMIRFRVNIHKQDGKIALAARSIPNEVPTPEQLRFEKPLYEFANLLDGLVLVVGPSGHGKSTTIASMIEQINATRKSHIITIEDPIEFAFKDKMSLIEQREIGTDAPSFASALKHVLRQDPDVIFVGEMRDPETIATVLTAAETGHLVFSTLHTSSAAEAVERIIDVFDGPKQKQALIQLSTVLRAVVSQQLIPTIDNRRIAAREILINTPAVGNMIRRNTIEQIPGVIETGAETGMISMDRSIQNLLEQGLIDQDTATKRTGRQRKI